MKQLQASVDPKGTGKVIITNFINFFEDISETLASEILKKIIKFLEEND